MTEPTPHRSPDPLRKLDHDLAAFEASRQRGGRGGLQEAAEGYRLLYSLLSGVFGGLGIGWAVDHYAPRLGFHTAPFGIVLGLLIGVGVSIYATIRIASRLSAKARAPKPNDVDEG